MRPPVLPRSAPTTRPSWRLAPTSCAPRSTHSVRVTFRPSAIGEPDRPILRGGRCPPSRKAAYGLRRPRKRMASHPRARLRFVRTELFDVGKGHASLGVLLGSCYARPFDLLEPVILGSRD